MTDKELMQQALEALEDACGGRCNAENNPCWQRSVANALRGRVEQLKPLRPWVGLTEEELYEIYDESDDGSSPCGVCGACSKCKIEVAIARAIEAKLRSKNT